MKNILGQADSYKEGDWERREQDFGLAAWSTLRKQGLKDF